MTQNKGPVKSGHKVSARVGWRYFTIFFKNFDGPSKIVDRNFRAHQILQDLFGDPPIFFQPSSQHTSGILYKMCKMGWTNFHLVCYTRLCFHTF